MRKTPCNVQIKYKIKNVKNLQFLLLKLLICMIPDISCQGVKYPYKNSCKKTRMYHKVSYTYGNRVLSGHRPDRRARSIIAHRLYVTGF